MSRTTTIRLALRAALIGNIKDWEWLYLPASELLTPDTPCLLIAETTDENLDLANSLGFPREGLDGQTIRDTAVWAQHFSNPPSDELLLESFNYYLEFDAFFPNPGAAPPPSPSEIARKLDREFYDSLGPEMPDTTCRAPNCSRGTVAHSVMCKKHHFEMVMRKECPFDGPRAA